MQRGYGTGRVPSPTMYSRDVRPTCAFLVVAAAATTASAGGIAIVGGSPRTIGRAGTGTVGDDGGGALLVNPAALARRESTRLSLGLGFVDDTTTWDADLPDAPIARDQAGSRIVPLAAAITSVRGWVIGAGVITTGLTERAYRDPIDVPVPANLGARFEYRYAGIAGRVRRDIVTLGVARRVGDTAAFGISLGASRIALRERRRLWAGFAGITPVGDPSRDVEVELDGEDGFVPSVTGGILVAPEDSPLELAASVAWTARTEIEGIASARGVLDGPTVRLTSPTASMGFRQPLAVRAGVRYLGDRVVGELGGDLWIAPDATRETSWAVRGVQVIDPSSVSTELGEIPSRLSVRTHGAVRGAVDVELIGGFLWATAGYAFTVGGTSTRRLSPTLGDLGGHTMALGVEATAGGFTLTLGWSRTIASRKRTGSEHALDNPFGAGDAEVPRGRYDGSADQLGLLLDIELDAPE